MDIYYKDSYDEKVDEISGEDTDSSVKYFKDKVTIVKGGLQVRNSFEGKIYKVTNKLEDLLFDLIYKKNSFTGKAILHEGDTFDPKTGKVIASRRAELKALKHAAKCIEKMFKEVDEVRMLLKNAKNEIYTQRTKTLSKLNKLIEGEK